MAALPLTLDTLQSPNNEGLATQSPLMSPQCLKADTSNNLLTTATTTLERPSNLTLDSSQQQQQHSNVTPSSSPALSSTGSLSPSFLPEMPQWKRDLIQRRKQNVQRTISASSPTATSSATSAAASPTYGGLKTSTSSSSMRSLAGSNTNIDQVASDGLHFSAKDYNKTSSLSSYSSTTTKVNKQHATTTTTMPMPAPIIKSSTATITTITSPIKEKAEKLFGGQYTATSSISATVTTTQTTKEEITTTTTMMEGLVEELQEEEAAEAEHLEKSKKTKEDDEHEENDETQTSSKQQQQQHQQMATTRLTGSTHNNILIQREGILMKERENFFSNTTVQQHHNITTTGANVILQNQSFSKCESEEVCTANSTAATTSCSVKISQKLKDNKFIKNEQQQQQNNTNTTNINNNKKFIKFKTNSNSQDLKSPTKFNNSNILTSSLSSSSLLTSTSATNCAIKKKMVAVQEMKKSTQNSATHLHPINTTCNSQQQQQANRAANNRSGVVGGVVGNSSATNATDLDNNEDLSYGPGIVSKLRCRYLSLALRETMEQQRLNKDQLRRSTSLNNLLDNNDDEENCDDDDDEEDEEEDNVEIEGDITESQKNKENSVCKKTGILKNSCNNQEKRFSHNSQGSNGVGVTFTETSFNKRSRHLKRGNDSLKRARSVEALLSEKSPWQSRAMNNTICTNLPTCVTIEDKIHNARERLQQGTDHMPPKRLTSIIDDTERPPPDLVKQTLKMFEASANRRPRTTNRSNSKGDVASKVETFKNIIKEQKPVVTYPKPLSPTKKLNSPNLQKPLKTSTPQASDLLQSPLGRKTMAMANSSNSHEGLTPLKSSILSDNTPDIIPRQKFTHERDFKQTKEKFTTQQQINKEKFLNSTLSNTESVDSPLNVFKREQKVEVDSPLTALTKELGKLKLSDNTTTTSTRKADNYFNDNQPLINNGGGGGVGGAGGGVGDGISASGDACYGHKNQHNNDKLNEQQELINNSSLKNENDKQKQINNETIDETNEATVNYNDSLTKASPPPSSSDLSDGEEDDEYGGLKTKRITRTALDNIAKAGYTQQFKFNTSNTTSSSPSSNNSHSSPLTSGKQIGVIRPLLNTSQQQQHQQKVVSSDMDTLKQHSSPSSLTSREIEKNRINDLKKSSPSSTTSSLSTSPPTASLDNVIKSTSSSASSSSSTTSGSSAAASSGYSDVDSVISATNSPLWAMRKRRQAPPAAPSDNTTMVFNFSNRKEVPDYIENDGVIFRRKRELPKPNESGFVLLGDLSVETSTDLDYDDFSMCPPSPCDVEFENANIVIDGKSSIRQKSKDASFRVQFNDTLTSTFEYPSEASLILDESFSAYNNDDYTQPHGSTSANDFTHAFQNLVLENSASSVEQLSSFFHHPIHHVADEIIQLPTINNASSPANTTNNTTGVTTSNTSILGNLPLDYPDLEKGIPLTIPTTTTATTITPITTQDNNNKLKENDQKLSEIPIIQKRSRKDLKLPLGNQYSLQKPPLPVKRFQMMSLPNKPQNLKHLPIILKNSEKQLQEKIVLNREKQVDEEDDIKNGNILKETAKECEVDVKTTTNRTIQRKTPRVLNNPQYACFLKQQDHLPKYPVQRSRSNEFQKSFSSLPMSTPVLRSNSLRNLEKFPTSTSTQQYTQSTFTTTSSLYFSSEVNSSAILLKTVVETAKNPALMHHISKSDNAFNELPQSFSTLNNFSVMTENSVNITENSPNRKSRSLSNLPQNTNSTKHLTNSSYDLTENSLNIAENSLNFNTKFVDNLDSTNLNNTTDFSVKLNENSLSSKDKSIDSTENSLKITENLLTSDDNFCEENENSKNITENLSNPKSKSDDAFKQITKSFSQNSNNSSTADDNFDSFTNSNDMSEYSEISLNSKPISMDNFNSSIESNALTKSSVIVTENLLNSQSNPSISDDNFISITNSNDLSELTDNLLNSKSISMDNFNSSLEYNDLTNSSAIVTENLLNLKSKSLDNFKQSDDFKKLTKTPVNITENLLNSNTNSHDKISSTLRLSIDETTDYFVNITNTSLHSKSLSVDNGLNRFDEELSANNFKDSNLLTKFSSSADQFADLIKNLQMSVDSLDEYQDALEANNLSLPRNISRKVSNLTVDTKDITNNFSNLTDETKNISKLTDETEDICEKTQNCYKNVSNLTEETKNIGNLTDIYQIYPGNDFESIDNIEINEITNSLDDSKKSNENLQQSNDDSSESDKLSVTEALESLNDSYNSNITPPKPQLKSKTLRVKTREKIITLTNMAYHNASTYSTFRKSQNFYRHASKSFKNSLKFYETLNAKNAADKVVGDSSNNTFKRSNSLTDHTFKTAETNRKRFSKSTKTKCWDNENYCNFNKDNLDSPTENSYSFEYFDALGDLNGNIINRFNRENVSNLTDNVVIEESLNLFEDEQNRVDYKFRHNLANDRSNNNEKLLTDKEITENSNSTNIITKNSVDNINLQNVNIEQKSTENNFQHHLTNDNVNNNDNTLAGISNFTNLLPKYSVENNTHQSLADHAVKVELHLTENIVDLKENINLTKNCAKDNKMLTKTPVNFEENVNLTNLLPKNSVDNITHQSLADHAVKVDPNLTENTADLKENTNLTKNCTKNNKLLAETADSTNHAVNVILNLTEQPVEFDITVNLPKSCSENNHTSTELIDNSTKLLTENSVDSAISQSLTTDNINETQHNLVEKKQTFTKNLLYNSTNFNENSDDFDCSFKENPHLTDTLDVSNVKPKVNKKLLTEISNSTENVVDSKISQSLNTDNIDGTQPNLAESNPNFSENVSIDKSSNCYGNFNENSSDFNRSLKSNPHFTDTLNVSNVKANINKKLSTEIGNSTNLITESSAYTKNLTLDNINENQHNLTENKINFSKNMSAENFTNLNENFNEYSTDYRQNLKENSQDFKHNSNLTKDFPKNKPNLPTDDKNLTKLNLNFTQNLLKENSVNLNVNFNENSADFNRSLKRDALESKARKDFTKNTLNLSTDNKHLTENKPYISKNSTNFTFNESSAELNRNLNENSHASNINSYFPKDLTTKKSVKLLTKNFTKSQENVTAKVTDYSNAFIESSKNSVDSNLNLTENFASLNANLTKYSPDFKFNSNYTEPKQNLTTDNSVKSLTDKSVKSLTDNSVKSSTDNSVKSLTDNSVKSQTDNSVKSLTDNSVKSLTDNSVKPFSTDLTKNQQIVITDNFVNTNLSLQPSSEKYFNASPRPFRRLFEATTLVTPNEDKNSPQCILNSPVNPILNSPRPFRRTYEAATIGNWDKNCSETNLPNFSVNSTNSLQSTAVNLKPFEKTITSCENLKEKESPVTNFNFNPTKFSVTTTNSDLLTNSVSSFTNCSYNFKPFEKSIISDFSLKETKSILNNADNLNFRPTKFSVQSIKSVGNVKPFISKFEQNSILSSRAIDSSASLAMDGATFAIGGSRLTMYESKLAMDESRLATADSSSFAMDESRFATSEFSSIAMDESSSLAIDGSTLAIDRYTLAIDGSTLAINGSRLTMNESKLAMDESRLADSSSLVIPGSSLAIDGSKLEIDDSSSPFVTKFEENSTFSSRAIGRSTFAIYDSSSLAMDESALAFNESTLAINDPSSLAMDDSSSFLIDQSALASHKSSFAIDEAKLATNGTNLAINDSSLLNASSHAFNASSSLPYNNSSHEIDSSKFSANSSTFLNDSYNPSPDSRKLSINSSKISANSLTLPNDSLNPADDSCKFPNSFSKISARKSPPLPPKTFSNTKHLKLKQKLGLHDNLNNNTTLTVKDPTCTLTSTRNTNNTVNPSTTTSTNIKTMVEVSKSISKTSSTISCSSFSSNSRSSTKYNSTAKYLPEHHYKNSNATTISSKSSTPPKVLPRRIFATAPPRTFTETKTSSTTSTTAITQPTTTVSSTSSSSTSSSRNKASSTSSCNTTSNNTPLRRRIPGNTLYYV